ncbi:NAD(P)H-dependent oxidoreductase [Porphyromonas sp.]|uniref:NAD(P)H-dependent oxidoreductase n=1 Tax=Porphyromonas sp. TaxID=1924944 RepID=UPI0026DC9FFA|nr:NAD(P)H-dependent oxidoreductase [Porphyromonas sp.]MDO4695757.1 NAD(P)H-dependent oxidoreductase [Porphyromonas sp.]MDO4770308.1 NAD(P)H-dependent oxidoreductase [Porphyromonas sp.]
MKTLVVVGHPNLSGSCINRRWTEALKSLQSEDLHVHVLTDVVKIDGSFDLLSEQALLQKFDRIILQFPLYWYMVPGIMKVWMDTVWAEGWCYGEGGTHMEGKLLEVAVSCGAPDFCFDESIPGNISLEKYMSFIIGTAGFIRAKAGGVFAFYGAGSPNLEERLEENTKQYIDFVLQKK